MFWRCIATLLVSLAAGGAGEIAPGFPQETSGGRWTGYEPAGATTLTSNAQLQKRGDELMVTFGYWASVNRLTGVVNPAPRPAFSPETETIVGDGDGPVFWTRPRGESPNLPYFIRNWTTGEKVGEITLPADLWPGYLDAHGMVALNGLRLYTTDAFGQNPREATLTSLGIGGYSFKIAGCERWLAISYMTNESVSRVAILDRATLELKGNHPGKGSQITLHGDLLAARQSGFSGPSWTMLYQLPSLQVITGLPNESPTQDGTLQLRLTEGNLWILQQLSTQEGCVFVQYDLSELPTVRLRQRVSPPGHMPSTVSSGLTWVAAENYLGVIDESDALWIWNRDPQNDPYQPLLTLEPWREGPEGGTAQARLVLSDPVDWPVEVTLRARSGSALEGPDFAPWTQTITIPAGDQSILAEVPIVADTTLEPREFFELTVESTSGALAETKRVALVIAGNGYNLEANPPTVAGGTMRWTGIWGSDGEVLVGYAVPVSWTPGTIEGPIMVDLLTGNLIARLEGVGPPSTSNNIVFRDGLMIIGGSSVSTWRTDTGALVSSWPVGGHSGSFAGAVDATKVLIRHNYPKVLELRRLSDGVILASIPITDDESVAVSHNARDGNPSTIHLYRTGGGVFERVKYNRLFELDPSTLAATETVAWRSSDQRSGDLAEILTVWQDKVVLSTYRGLTAVNRATGIPQWHIRAAVSGLGEYGHAISGNVMALTQLFTGSVESVQTTRFVDLPSGTEFARTRPQDLSIDGQWWDGAAFAHDDGWVLSSRAKSFRVVKAPDRPNVKIVAPVIEENIAATLQVVPLEGFTGTYPIRVSEFTDLSEDRAPAEALLSGLPVNLQVDADGVDFTVAATRSVNGLENTWLRATAPGRKTQLAGILRTVVDTHVITVPNGAFTTGGPLRSTRARSIAVSDPLLAVGYPLEQPAGAPRAGLVDVYNRQTGVFLRTLQAPPGTEGKRFGHAVGMAGTKVIVGAPGTNTVGHTFAFDGNTGTLIQELVLKGKAGEFGSAISVNDRWIAVSAPGVAQTPRPGSAQKATGIVMVFDATTLKPVMTKSTKGEGFGHSIALSGDKLFVSAPGAPYKKMNSVGIVRAFSIPKGKQLGTIMARQPAAQESFGYSLDASGSVLAIGGVFDRTINAAALQAHSTSDLGFLGYYSMPGDVFAFSRVKAHGDWMIGGGQTLRFFRPDHFRPVASRRIVDPGGPVIWPSPYYYGESNLAIQGEVLYWADYVPKIMAMPEIPATTTFRMLAGASAGNDPNGDGRTDELDLLFSHRGSASLPAHATLQQSTGDRLRFLIQADPDVPPRMDLWFEVSADLKRWDPLLQWQHDSPGWRDKDGVLLEVVSAEGTASVEYHAETKHVFFRTRAASR